MKKVIVAVGFAAILVILFLIVVGNSAKNESEANNSSLNFVKEPSDVSVISTGMLGLPTTTSDPFVLKDESGYHLFYSNAFCNDGLSLQYSHNPADLSNCDLYDEGLYTIGYAFSADKGLTWEFRPTPVIQNDKNYWDQQIETANVIKVDDELVMFYSAYAPENRVRYQIGAATLTLNEETVYQKLMVENALFDRNGRDAPVIPGNPIGHFDMNTQEPSVIYRNGNFEVYYVGLELKEDIPLDKSTDPGIIKGVGMGKATLDSDLNLIDRSSEPILKRTNIMEITEFNGKNYLFTTTGGGNGEAHKDQKIGIRVSEDQGNTWSDEKIILTKGTTDAFDNWGIMAPTVVKDNKDLILFYTAFGVGDINTCFSEPKERWGVPIENASKCSYASLGRAVCHECILD